MKELHSTGLTFEWLKGSASDNMTKVFKENNIDFYYNHFFSLVADLYGIGEYLKVDYKYVENDTFEIVIVVE